MAVTPVDDQGDSSSLILPSSPRDPQKLEKARQPLPTGLVSLGKTQWARKRTPSPNGSLILDAAQAHWHLDLLGRDERDTNIRAIPHKGMEGPAINGIFAYDLERAEELQRRGYGVYLQPNPGGRYAHEIEMAIALFFEHDDLPKEQQLTIWIPLHLPQPTFQVDTGGKSIHHWYVLFAAISIARWKPLMDRLIAHAKSDRSCKGANRMMRMAGSWYIDHNGDAIAQSQIINATDIRYDADLFERILPPLPEQRHSIRTKRRKQQDGSHNIRRIIEALGHIPQRVAGSGSYSDYRNLLWGLIAACAEAGYSEDVAIELMEEHSPSKLCGWDIPQVARSGGAQIGAGTFWWHAKQHRWRDRNA